MAPNSNKLHREPEVYELQEIEHQKQHDDKTPPEQAFDKLKSLEKENHLQERVNNGMKVAGDKAKEFERQQHQVVQNATDAAEAGAEFVGEQAKGIDDKYQLSEKVSDGINMAGDKIKEFDENNDHMIEETIVEAKAQMGKVLKEIESMGKDRDINEMNFDNGSQSTGGDKSKEANGKSNNDNNIVQSVTDSVMAGADWVAGQLNLNKQQDSSSTKQEQNAGKSDDGQGEQNKGNFK